MRKTKLKELNSLIEELKIVKKTLINENPKFLSIERYQCETNDGRILCREKLSKNNSNGNAVIILPLTSTNEVILTVQPRVFTNTTIGISLPAGYQEDNELPKAAALRELKEETGYVPEKLIECCTFYQDDGISSALNRGYIALNCHKEYSQELDKDEYIKYFTCYKQELLELLNQGYILDVGSQLVIEKAKKYLKK